jgi:hypothetical protein
MQKKRLFFLVLLGFLGSLFQEVSGKTFALSAADRVMLKERLKRLEGHKTALESKTGSLDKQRRYQQKIDFVKTKLGAPLVPFSLGLSDKKPGEKIRFLPEKKEESPVLSSRARSGGVDFFHDKSQVMNIRDSIKEQGGIKRRSTLLDALPPAHNRAVSQPPKGGILIDGEAPLKPIPPLGGPLSFQQTQLASSPLYAQKRAPLEEKQEGTLGSKGSAVLTQGPRPTSVWAAGNVAAAQDQQKMGWSMPAPLISAPLFSQPQMRGGVQQQIGASQEMAHHDASQQAPPTHRCSFSPHKLVRVWQAQ